MSTVEKVGTQVGNTCVGAVAIMLGDPSGGILVAQSAVGLAAIGAALKGESARTAYKNAYKKALAALKDSPEFRSTNPERLLTILETTTATLTRQDLIAASQAASDLDLDRTLAESLHATLDFDGDTDATKTILLLALEAGMRACNATPGFRDEMQAVQLLYLTQQVAAIDAKLTNVAEAVDDIATANRDLLEALANRFRIPDAFDLPTATLRADLEKHAEDYRRVLKEIGELKGTSERIDNIHAAAMEAMKNYQLEDAKQLLRDARTILREEKLRPVIEQNARLMVAEADLELLDQNIEAAFTLLSAAADSYGVLDPEEPAHKRLIFIRRLRDHGLRYGGIGLLRAKSMAKRAASQLTKEQDPLAWGEAHNLLGLVCTEQGTRTKGPDGNAMLAEAATAYLDALQIFTEADHPLQWARTTQNLAITLETQGNRTPGVDGAALRANAIEAYRAALHVATEADHPLDWAMTIQNLAAALATQGILTQGVDGAALLAEAVEACQNALRVRTEADHPLDWAITMQNLANTLQTQGTRTTGSECTALLAMAVTAHRDALRVFTEADHPIQWAETTQNLAAALQAQGARIQGRYGNDILEKAVAANRDALRVASADGHPLQWANANQNLGNALATQGARTPGTDGAALLAQAVAAFRAALRVRTEADHPLEWATVQENLALAEQAIADHDATDDPLPHLRAALEHVEAALTVYDPGTTGYYHEKATRLRDALRARLAAAT